MEGKGMARKEERETGEGKFLKVGAYATCVTLKSVTLKITNKIRQLNSRKMA